MQYSIVIRAFNEAQHIGRLLEGIARQTVADPETIVVDSGSTDATVAIAERYGAMVVHIPSSEFSFGRSLNIGVRAASNEIVVVASAHVYPVYADWIRHLLQPFEDPRVAVVYGKQRGGETTLFSERQVFRQWFPEVDAVPPLGPFCNNANAAIRRSLWEKHEYDETLTGLEDVAWAKWAQEQGHHVRYAPEAEVVHVHNERPRLVYNRYRREAMAFKRIFAEAHFSAYDFLRLTVANIWSDLLQAAREKRPWRYPVSIFWFRIAQFWGTYQGYRQSGPLTQQLRGTFYYPGGPDQPAAAKRQIAPIRYDE